MKVKDYFYPEGIEHKERIAEFNSKKQDKRKKK